MIRLLFLILAFCSLSAAGFAQTDSTKTAENPCPPYESMPRFPGGETELYNYIRLKVQYPPDAMENEVEGSVRVRFMVATDGSVTNVHVPRSVHPSLDREAIRVVSQMPKWTPGCREGKPVATEYSLPISFKLQ